MRFYKGNANLLSVSWWSCVIGLTISQAFMTCFQFGCLKPAFITYWVSFWVFCPATFKVAHLHFCYKNFLNIGIWDAELDVALDLWHWTVPSLLVCQFCKQLRK